MQDANPVGKLQDKDENDEFNKIAGMSTASYMLIHLMTPETQATFYAYARME